MNPLYTAVKCVFIVAFIAALIGLKIQESRIEYYKIESQKLSSSILLQNSAIAYYQQEYLDDQKKLSEAVKSVAKQKAEQIRRSETIFIVPEIEDCKEAVKWGATKSKELANAWIVS